MVSLESIAGQMVQMPATILKQLDLGLPSNLISGIELSPESQTERIVVVYLDNFGLLEVALHKPQFLLQKCNLILTLETSNGYASNVTSELIHGNLREKFHLFSYLIE